LTNIQKQQLARKTKPFTLQKGIMYCMGQDNKFKCYVTTNATQMILLEFHEGFSGGHFVVNINAKKILEA
jgi:hypothetical protein